MRKVLLLSICSSLVATAVAHATEDWERVPLDYNVVATGSEKDVKRLDEASRRFVKEHGTPADRKKEDGRHLQGYRRTRLGYQWSQSHELRAGGKPVGEVVKTRSISVK